MDSISKRVAFAGMLTALAMVFSYVEVLLPFSIGIWGIKLGLANLVVLCGLYFLPAKDVFLVSMTRIFLTALLFGTVVSLAYSLTGGVLSFCVMYILKKRQWFSMTGVSIAGGLVHNLGQILVASRLLASNAVFVYLPVLMISGILAGLVIGITSEKIYTVLRKERIFLKWG